MSNDTGIKNYPNRRDNEAVERIRQIIGELGPHSYVRAAMDGVLEMAEDNVQKGIYRSYKREMEVMQLKEEALKQTIQKSREAEKRDEDICAKDEHIFSEQWFAQKDRLEKDMEEMKRICVGFVEIRQRIEKDLEEMQKTLAGYMVRTIDCRCDRTLRREKEKEECTIL